MKKGLFLLVLLSPCFLFSQGGNGDTIYINFDKVVHIVLPYTVELVEAGNSSSIEAVSVPEKDNLVRIVVLEEKFHETNVTIIDKSGNLFTYQVLYSEDANEHPSIFYPSGQTKTSYIVFLNKDNKAFLVFPEEIIYVRSGSEEFTPELTKAKNIVSISTTGEVYSSNIFCIDKNSNEYNFLVKNGRVQNYIYNMKNIIDTTKNEEKPAKIINNTENINTRIENIMKLSADIFNLGVNKNKIVFSIPNVFVDEKYIYLKIMFENNSNINYEVDFSKFFFIDKKTAKNEVKQEIPVLMINDFDLIKISGKGKHESVFVFPKFTIPDDKYFRIEIFEKSGGRHIYLHVTNSNIIKAKRLP